MSSMSLPLIDTYSPLVFTVRPCIRIRIARVRRDGSYSHFRGGVGAVWVCQAALLGYVTLMLIAFCFLVG
jgi:hypothetical protein